MKIVEAKEIANRFSDFDASAVERFGIQKLRSRSFEMAFEWMAKKPAITQRARFAL
jgi:hypothetical protein